VISLLYTIKISLFQTNMMRLRTKITLWRHDGVPETRLFCHKMSLEQNSLACPIESMYDPASCFTSSALNTSSLSIGGSPPKFWLGDCERPWWSNIIVHKQVWASNQTVWRSKQFDSTEVILINSNNSRSESLTCVTKQSELICVQINIVNN